MVKKVTRRLFVVLVIIVVALGIFTLVCCRVETAALKDIKIERQTGEFLNIEGREVHIKRSGEGEPLILIHGFGGSTFAWRKVMPGLSENFDVIAIDLYGFGYTERPEDKEMYSLTSQAELINKVMESLDIESAHILGHSYGGDVILVFADKYPDKTRSLIFVDGGRMFYEKGDFGFNPIVVSLNPIIKPVVKSFAELLIFNEEGVRFVLEGDVYSKNIVTDEMVQGYLDHLMVEGFENSLNGFLSKPGLELPEVDISKIAKPVLLIWGRHDAVIPPRVGEQMKNLLPDAEIVYFENSAHLPMEEEPLKFIRVITEFIQIDVE